MARSTAKSPAEKLQAVAKGLTDAGYYVHALRENKKPMHGEGYLATLEAVQATSEAALGMVLTGKSTGISIVSGRTALYGPEGETFVLSAIEFEGKALLDETFTAAWDIAVDRAGLRQMWGRLENGWKERTPSGGLRWFFRVEAPNASYAETLLGLSGPQDALRGGQTYAEILTSKASIVIAPSYGDVHRTGKPYERLVGGPTGAPTLRFAEVNALSELMGEVGDVREVTSESSPSDALDGRSRRLLAQYNSAVSDVEMAEVIERHGWVRLEVRRDGEISLERKGGGARVFVGGDRHQGAAWTWSPSSAPLWKEQHMRPADVLCALEYGGNYDAMLQDLQEKGLVKHIPWPLSVRKPTVIYPDRSSRQNLGVIIGEAIMKAQHPTAKGLPFVLGLTHPQTGDLIAPVSLDNEHALRRWAPSSREDLLLSIVQPKKQNGKGEESFVHGLPHSIVEAVLPSEGLPPSLSTVSYAATEPVLLPDGQTVSTPGYHPEKRALVAIPQRERAFWKAYKVPENPSLIEVQTAADFLHSELLPDFPFATLGDKARALGYLLTATSRELYGACPGWVLDASERGSGKTLLATLMRILSTGRTEYSSVGYSRASDEETKKATVAASLSGAKHLHVDELPRGEQVNSKVLMELMTGDGTGKGRVLGASKEIAIAPMMVTVCGNNAEVGGDSNRRFMSIRMVNKTSMLAFERTMFRHDDIQTWARLNRPRLLAAAHTILAYGLKHQKSLAELPKGYGSFEGWMGVVGNALSNVTMDGQNAMELFHEGRREFVEDNDDEANDWGPFLAEWVKLWEDNLVTAKIVHSKLGKTGNKAFDIPDPLRGDLGLSEAGQIKSWGRVFSQWRDSTVSYAGLIYRLDVRRNKKTGNSFRVVRMVDAGATAHSEQPAETAPVTVSTPPVAVSLVVPLIAKPARSGVVESSDILDLEAA